MRALTCPEVRWLGDTAWAYAKPVRAALGGGVRKPRARADIWRGDQARLRVLANAACAGTRCECDEPRGAATSRVALGAVPGSTRLYVAMKLIACGEDGAFNNAVVPARMVRRCWDL